MIIFKRMKRMFRRVNRQIKNKINKQKKRFEPLDISQPFKSKYFDNYSAPHGNFKQNKRTIEKMFRIRKMKPQAR
jgi:hypothetical protein